MSTSKPAFVCPVARRDTRLFQTWGVPPGPTTARVTGLGCLQLKSAVTSDFVTSVTFVTAGARKPDIAVDVANRPLGHQPLHRPLEGLGRMLRLLVRQVAR